MTSIACPAMCARTRRPFAFRSDVLRPMGRPFRRSRGRYVHVGERGNPMGSRSGSLHTRCTCGVEKVPSTTPPLTSSHLSIPCGGHKSQEVTLTLSRIPALTLSTRNCVALVPLFLNSATVATEELSRRRSVPPHQVSRIHQPRCPHQALHRLRPQPYT